MSRGGLGGAKGSGPVLRGARHKVTRSIYNATKATIPAN